jgi:CheY-like chemotaxis protein
MLERRTQCEQTTQLSPFLAGTLQPEKRRMFAAHLAACESCAAVLEVLREDERLAAAPLTVEEQTQIGRIVRSVRAQFRRYVESAFGPSPSRSQGRKRVRRISILVVDDDPDYNTLLHEAFAEAGFVTQRAGDGRQAFELLQTGPVDLVVADFILPEMDGLELCRLVRSDAQLSQVKVVLYSGHPYAGLRQDARASGALDYLPKSFDTQGLVEQVCEIAGVRERAASAGPSGPWTH